MNKDSFIILSRTHDVNVLSFDIRTKNDGLYGYFEIPVRFVFRKIIEGTHFDISTLGAKLKLENTVLSETIECVDISIMNDETICYWVKFRLDEKSISYIEKKRSENIIFTLELAGTAIIKSVLSIEKNKEVKSFDGLLPIISNSYIEIAHSEWIKHLSNLGFESFKLFEVPMTHPTLREAYPLIIKELSDAEKYYKGQDYNKCIAHCRMALDPLTRNLLKIKREGDSETNFKWLKNISESTFIWLNTIHKETTGVSSKTHHLGNNRDFYRYEAESIYLMTLGLVNLIGGLKRAYQQENLIETASITIEN